MMPGGSWHADAFREAEPRPRGLPLGALMLSSLGGACAVFAVISLTHRRVPPAAHAPDVLSNLLGETRPSVAGPQLTGREVTFPSLLSDDPKPTTALAAVRPGQTQADSNPKAKTAGAAQSASERPPLLPLPARSLVGSSAWLDRPRDPLSQLAKQAAGGGAPPAAPGHAGGYQLQAGSFRTADEAASFAAALRQRGHRAYTEVGQVQGRGPSYRVRIGPFNTKKEALAYRTAFEAREHLVPFVLDPQ
jgi:cell division septation protein DedD